MSDHASRVVEAPVLSSSSENPAPRWPAHLLHVVLPMVLGTAIYLLLRDRSLWVFSWVRALGVDAVDSTLESARELVYPHRFDVPAWVRFNLPDACWVYAVTAFFALVWRDGPRRTQHAWMAVGPVIGVGIEFGQLIHVVPGTFDAKDVAVCLCAAASPWLFLRRNP